MNSLFRQPILKAVSFISRLYTYKLGQRLSGYRNVLYTAWLRHYIGRIGDNSMIAYPCSMQGGGSRRISIGDHTCIKSHCILGCWEEYNDQAFSPSIVIGNNCCIGEYNHITACNKITVGDGLLSGRFVYIGDNTHGGFSWKEADIPPAMRTLQSKGEVIIGKNVWLGDKVTILGGVTIGDNVIIGANSVVTRDIPSNCIAAGGPAKIIKQLDK